MKRICISDDVLNSDCHRVKVNFVVRVIARLSLMLGDYAVCEALRVCLHEIVYQDVYQK